MKRVFASLMLAFALFALAVSPMNVYANGGGGGEYVPSCRSILCLDNPTNGGGGGE